MRIMWFRPNGTGGGGSSPGFNGATGEFCGGGSGKTLPICKRVKIQLHKFFKQFSY